MRTVLLAVILTATAGAGSAQIHAPGQIYIGAPMADRLRSRTEAQRLQSEQQAAFARQQQLNARLTEMELRAQRQPEPDIPLVDIPASPDARRRAREAATTRHQTTVSGVTQIDDWLARGVR